MVKHIKSPCKQCNQIKSRLFKLSLKAKDQKLKDKEWQWAIRLKTKHQKEVDADSHPDIIGQMTVH